MSETENSQQQPELQDEQLKFLRNSLIKSTFESYHNLINVIKKLPIPQMLPGLQKALLDIDTGMLWIKEILNTAPLMFAPPTQKKEEAPKEENQSSEPNEVKESEPKDSTPENDSQVH